MVLKNFLYFSSVFFLFSCSNESSISEVSTENEPIREAKTLYVLHCETCHGMDGTKGTSNAANLQTSKLADAEVKSVILNGNDKGMMPYKTLITNEKEIDALVEYVKNLRK
jgi:mono/diheme cytochrome c family protein